MSRRIELKFDNTISRLAGNEFGQSIYKNQVEPLIDFKDKNIIIIPQDIKDIAISFVQGFSSEILNKIDKTQFFDYIQIEASEKIKNKFERALYF